MHAWSLALEARFGIAAGIPWPGPSYIRLRLWDQALADLERASAWAHPDATLQWGVVATYAGCLAQRPRQFGRWVVLLRRAARQSCELARRNAGPARGVPLIEPHAAEIKSDPEPGPQVCAGRLRPLRTGRDRLGRQVLTRAIRSG